MPSKRRRRLSHALHADIWVEVKRRRVITARGADLLEQIAINGSLLESTRKLGIGYRAAWALLNTMNKSWPKPLVTLKTGGHGGGGTYLTKTGQHVLRTYRDLQAQLEHLLDTAGREALAALL